MKSILSISILLGTLATAFSQEAFSDLNNQSKPIDIQLFGKNGFTLKGPLDIPIDRSWYIQEVPHDTKLYHYGTERLSMSEMTTRVIEVINHRADSEVAVVVRAFFKGGKYSERYLLQVPAKERLRFDLSTLVEADSIELYSITDFGMRLQMEDTRHCPRRSPPPTFPFV